MKKRLWGVFLGIGMFCVMSLWAGESSMHTVTIRIVRPNLLKTASTFPAEPSVHQLAWETGNAFKKITASVSSGMPSGLLRIKGALFFLSSGFDTDLLLLPPRSVGRYRVHFVKREACVRAGIIFYTITEM